MDEYKHYVYQRDDVYSSIDAGDLTEQIALRDRLECKSFKWFIEEVAPDLIKKYPPIEPNNYASGAVQNLLDPSLCIDMLGYAREQIIGVYQCAENKLRPQAPQYFELTAYKDIRVSGRQKCWDAANTNGAEIYVLNCHRLGRNQYWRYDYVS